MASFQRFEALVEDVFEGIHDFENDQLSVALLAAANAPDATNGRLSDLTEISYANCSSRNVSTVSSSQTGGIYKVVAGDLTLLATGGSVGPFRYVVLYNADAPNDELIGWYDNGSEITLADGESVTIDFDDVNGVFTLT